MAKFLFINCSASRPTKYFSKITATVKRDVTENVLSHFALLLPAFLNLPSSRPKLVQILEHLTLLSPENLIPYVEVLSASMSLLLEPAVPRCILQAVKKLWVALNTVMPRRYLGCFFFCLFLSSSFSDTHGAHLCPLVAHNWANPPPAHIPTTDKTANQNYLCGCDVRPDECLCCRLWIMTVNALRPSAKLLRQQTYTQNDLMVDPLIVLRCDQRVYR